MASSFTVDVTPLLNIIDDEYEQLDNEQLNRYNVLGGSFIELTLSQMQNRFEALEEMESSIRHEWGKGGSKGIQSWLSENHDMLQKCRVMAHDADDLEDASWLSELLHRLNMKVIRTQDALCPTR